MNPTEARGCTTMVLWVTYLGFLYLSIASIGVWVIGLALVVFIPLFLSMGFLWNLFKDDTPSTDHRSEKRKQKRVERLLNALSETELDHLRQRLSDDAETPIAHYLGDDGELVDYEYK